MKKFIVLLLLITQFSLSFSQSLDFEKINKVRNTPIGWQTENANIDSIFVYQGKFSVRLNCDVNAQALAPRISLKCSGDSISLKGYILTDNIDSKVDISLNLGKGKGIDVSEYFYGKKVRFENNNSKKWSEFNINVPLCPEVKYCEIFILTNGAGSVWIDDLNILVDGKTLSEVTSKEHNITYNAIKDKRFDKGSDFLIKEDLTDIQIENLNILCKVWGFLKYYHPMVTQGNFNWDYELFDILPKIYNVNSDTRNKLLCRWIDNIGDFNITKSVEVKDGDLHLAPDLEWVDNVKILGKELSTKLNDIKLAKRSPFSYYVSKDLYIGYVNFNNENVYSSMNYNDTGVKLVGVFRLWNVVKYFYPYRDLTSDWDRALNVAIRDMIKSNSNLDYQYSLSKMICSLNDSHAMISDDYATLIYSHGKFCVPFTSKYIDSSFVVSNILKDDMKFKMGDAITHINNKLVKDYIDSVKYYSPSSNFEQLANKVSKIINLSKDNSIRYTFYRGDNKMIEDIEAYSYDEVRKIINKSASRRVPSKIINDSIAYIDFGGINPDEINLIFNDYMKYENLILDLRGYPKIESHKYISKLCHGKFEICKAIKADLSQSGRFVVEQGEYIGINNNKSNRTIYVLVDNQTISHSEYCVMMLQTIPGTRVVGNKTAGADGDVITLNMPGNVRVSFTGIGILYPDGGETQRVGVRIDEIVKPTIKGIREGRDEVLERAIEIINSKTAK